jgi:pimeloyl-ACP methyl ester carboxylesterase
MPKVAFGLLEEIADPRWRAARQGWRRGRGQRPGEDFFVPFGLWNGAKRTAARWIQLLRTTGAWQELQSDGLGLAEIRCIAHPTLLIYGERSRWIRTCEALGHAMVNSRTVILPKAGHFFPLLNPAGFALHLRQFLDLDRDLRGGLVGGRNWSTPYGAAPRAADSNELAEDGDPAEPNGSATMRRSNSRDR